MRIAIVGAGISGLRAALEMTHSRDITIFEKSPGVGGRVATRRADSVQINHGAPKFDRTDILTDDPFAEKYSRFFDFKEGATALPKAMRDDLLNSGVKFMLNTRVASVEDKKIILEDKSFHSFEAMILTAPIPQIMEMVGTEVLPHIEYTKEILFIGARNGQPVIERVPSELVEDLFDLSEEEIRKRFHPPADLALKKWRYSQVKSGSRKLFCKITDRMLIAGDAFDPTGNWDLASAWISGRSAGMFLG